ncbi:MAG: ABC transporter permease [Micrococcales bacterium 70-64]|nr:ABC transporter permease [Leifsonia sp.]ODU66008.1 MAG: ABC transporter permease [Leifsonia sp. SCN 70-46]OJX84634.1 MAG: ABC transporter permease [Micrococcales bacterium 70-64]
MTNPLAAIPPEGSGDIITIEQQDVAGLSQGAIVRRRFVRHIGAMVSLGVLIVIVIMAFSSVGFNIFGLKIPGWWKYDFTNYFPIERTGGAPTWDLPFSFGNHPFGQDDIGHDVFAQVMRGTQQSIILMIIYGAVSAIIGITVGAISGFFRGKVDTLLMRLTDVIIIVPVVLLGAVIGRTYGGLGVFVLALTLGAFGWAVLARLMRGEFLSLREREFVDAARVAGASNMRIIFRHILPNTAGVLIVNVSLTMSGAILLEAALGYLGFGINPPDVSLGQILAHYQSAFATRPWLFWWPGIVLIIIVLAINFIGDGLRDAFDPRQRRMPAKPGPYRELGQLLSKPFRRGGSGTVAADAPVGGDRP